MTAIDQYAAARTTTLFPTTETMVAALRGSMNVPLSPLTQAAYELASKYRELIRDLSANELIHAQIAEIEARIDQLVITQPPPRSDADQVPPTVGAVINSLAMLWPLAEWALERHSSTDDRLHRVWFCLAEVHNLYCDFVSNHPIEPVQLPTWSVVEAMKRELEK
ncbi:hypothetical protein IU500_18750 [Nocardia terpenica]|uniref:hypothetical protein n=1 Tax=Nocardia terpenica TaxID=455432 RepID=UPI0018952D65|nr:hypothetical protein [Nocardia terpenica]MBF6063527.1 hypothetical protein [Nocardia terpenica]MBF6106083.1 hypothetical protein [Nocardia terpenica]MBF6113332.1 hypothetical protein [Nocardia terpenica]MBF6119824.1 hypothetical protein [Nocardia terpenica]MBF6152235.1 hypothetical protein [Nocardia terpenica]